MYSKINSSVMALLIFTLVMSSTFANADVVIIVNKANMSSIDKEFIKKVFVGRTKVFSDGSKAIPVELVKGSARTLFLAKVLHKDEGALQSYWTRMIFTGKGNPPQQFVSDVDLKKHVAKDINAVGFIDKDSIDDSVRVIEIK